MVTHLHVERLGDELLVTWRGGDDPTVFVSASPDDAGTVIIPVAAPGKVRVAGIPDGLRAYVHLLDTDGSWTVGTERRLAVPGTDNLRDVGGHRTADGRQVRWGRLLRGGALDDLGPDGTAALARVGVATVCDVRSVSETIAAPAGAFEALVAPVRLPIGPIGTLDGETATPDDEVADRIAAGEDPAAAGHGIADEVLGRAYLLLLERHADVVAQVVERVADRAGHPLLVHGATGVHRTGLVTAVLLGAVGVPDPVVLDDYELSNRYVRLRPTEDPAGSPSPPDSGPARRPALAATLSALRARHDSPAGYLTTFAGVAPATVERLRAALLDPG